MPLPAALPGSSAASSAAALLGRVKLFRLLQRHSLLPPYAGVEADLRSSATPFSMNLTGNLRLAGKAQAGKLP